MCNACHSTKNEAPKTAQGGTVFLASAVEEEVVEQGQALKRTATADARKTVPTLIVCHEGMCNIAIFTNYNFKELFK
jgi:hypothetical protein